MSAGVGLDLYLTLVDTRLRSHQDVFSDHNTNFGRELFEQAALSTRKGEVFSSDLWILFCKSWGYLDLIGFVTLSSSERYCCNRGELSVVEARHWSMRCQIGSLQTGNLTGISKLSRHTPRYVQSTVKCCHSAA